MKRIKLTLPLLLAIGISLIMGAVPVKVENESIACTDSTKQTQVVAIMSKKMGREIKNIVVLPKVYAATSSDTVKYPTLYLLHGYSGDYTNWSVRVDLEKIADLYGVVIVCPDGQDSWYCDSPVNPAMQYETYISNELVDYIDTHYRVYATPAMRAITGLSMGGMGALWNAWRHPDVFGSCGSMSGAVDITPWPNTWNIKQLLGDYDTHADVWRQHTLISLVPSLKPGQNIIIDDGTDDVFYEVNVVLHNALLEQGIPHDFTIRPGSHTWEYWINSFDYHMLFFSKAFQAALENKQ